MAIDDGSYDELFFNNKIVKESLNRAKIENRLILRLNNSNMPNDTHFDVEKYWIRLDELVQTESH